MARVETEKKFYCNDFDSVITKAKELGFKEIDKTLEVDEYFTDINSIFIKDRTCLRIRKTNNKDMELTFKGRSTNNASQDCKFENNVSIDIKEYYNTIEFLSNLGYYSYVVLEKNRRTFEYKDENYEYNIMLDDLGDNDKFIEFEIISTGGNKQELLEYLAEFINKFGVFEEVVIPYRDIVAKSLMDKYVNKDILTINIDDYISKYIDIEAKDIVFENNYLDVIISLLNRSKLNININTNLDNDKVNKFLKNMGLNKEYKLEKAFNNISDDLKKIINLLLIIENN